MTLGHTEYIMIEFDRHCDLVNASSRKPTTKTTYIQHADRFERWLAGEIQI